MKWSLQQTLNNVEKEMIFDALKESDGNRRKAAQVLGISERVMGLRVRKYGLKPEAFKRAAMRDSEAR